MVLAVNSGRAQANRRMLVRGVMINKYNEKTSISIQVHDEVYFLYSSIYTRTSSPRYVKQFHEC